MFLDLENEQLKIYLGKKKLKLLTVLVKISCEAIYTETGLVITDPA